MISIVSQGVHCAARDLRDGQRWGEQRESFAPYAFGILSDG